MSEITTSIIIVHYKASDELRQCVDSITERESSNIEIIIVNNDEQDSLDTFELPVTIPSRIIHSDHNMGFGVACNSAVAHARGKYLFFLNPDTQLMSDAVTQVTQYLEQYPQVGVAAPSLYTADGERFPKQGSRRHSWLSFLVVESWLSGKLESSSIFRQHYYLDDDKGPVQAVSVVPGTAFGISKQLFEELGYFDERFFLYYEEVDLCHRVEDAGYQLVMLHDAQVMHHWGVSAYKDYQTATEHFWKSRKKYLYKYFGSVGGFLIYFICRVHWTWWALYGAALIVMIRLFFYLVEKGWL